MEYNPHNIGKKNDKNSCQKSESDRDGKDDKEFNQLICCTHLFHQLNERKNLLHTLLAVRSNERQQIESWLMGDESIENIIPLPP